MIGDNGFDFRKGKLMYDGKNWTNSDDQLIYFYTLLSAADIIGPPMYSGSKIPRYVITTHSLKKLKRPSEIGNGEREVI